MDKKEKTEKRNVIAKALDLSNTRLKDDEVEKLFDFVSNPEKYNGKSKTHRTWREDWDHDGKYERTITDEYTLVNNSEAVGVQLHSETSDDGALTYSGDSFINTARGILKLLDYFSKS